MVRFRSLGLLVAFVAGFASLVVALGAVAPPDMLVGSLITLVSALLCAGLLLRFAEHKSFGTVGFQVTRYTRRDIAVGLLIPILALLLVVGGMAAVGALVYQADDGGWRAWIAGMVGMFLVLMVPAAAEEALFRGYPFQKLVEGIGPLAATLLASAGFAFAHRHNPGVSTLALINIFVAGLVLSVAYLRTRSLWFATAVHLGWNWMMAGPLDLPLSGLELFDAPLYEPSVSAHEWLTGSRFGPEGGLSGFVALVLLTAGISWYTRFAAKQLRSYAANNESE